MINDKMAVDNSDTSNKSTKKGYFRDGSLFGASIKKGIQYSIDGTEIRGESLSQHKYSRLANASYDYFNSKGKIDAVHEGLQNSKYNYIDGRFGFDPHQLTSSPHLFTFSFFFFFFLFLFLFLFLYILPITTYFF